MNREVKSLFLGGCQSPSLLSAGYSLTEMGNPGEIKVYGYEVNDVDGSLTGVDVYEHYFSNLNVEMRPSCMVVLNSESNLVIMVLAGFDIFK